jgi:hypothetical protein
VVARSARRHALLLAILAGGLSASLINPLSRSAGEVAARSASGEGPAAELLFVCRNPASGATWDIEVDVKRSLADSYPARITDESITWHDIRHGGFYELDRRTGALTVHYASSTGGYALHDICKMAP